MRHKIGGIVPPLISIALVVLGLGFFVSFISVELKSEGASDTLIGVIHAAYSAGLLIGAFITERMIRLIGHIRSYAVTASLTSVTILIMGLSNDFYLWIGMRFFAGFCLSVQYVAIESWLLALGDTWNRGRILALYMMAFYFSQAFSQFFLDVIAVDTLQPYIVSSIFAALSVVPFSLTLYQSPEIPDVIPFKISELIKKTPLGFMGCLASGIILGCVYGFTPLYALAYDLPVSWLMFATIAGGVVLQWPMGKLSDYFNRRLVLLSLTSSLLIPSLLIMLFPGHLYSSLLFSFLIGGIGFTLYPLSIAEVCDHFQPSEITRITAVLLIIYGLGSVFGPIVAPMVSAPMGILGIYAFYFAIALLLVLFGIVVLKRERQALVIPKQDFVSLPSVTPVAYELDPRAEE